MVLISEAALGGGPHPPLVVAGARPEALLEALRPAVILAIWEREISAALRREAAALAAAPFEAVAEGPPDELLAALCPCLPCLPGPTLWRDMTGLAVLFASLTGQARLRLRLEAVAGEGCPRFHADSVGLRLLCTYRGPGTQWLPLPGGAAAARGLPERGLCGLGLPAPRDLPAGAVALLRGEGGPGQQGRGCIHRSPPQPPGAPPRLLLCLDEAGRIPPI